MDTAANEELLSQAAFVFEGTVIATNAVNLSIIEPSAGTAIVQVDHVLRAPASLSDQTGQQVTTQLLEPGSVQPGETFVFYTNGWLYGENMAVIEVGRQEAGIEALGAQIAFADAMIAENALRQRLNTADLVVLGRVMEMRRPETAEAEPYGEHDPEWWSAEIAIEEVLRGSRQKRSVTLTYPNSTDITWYQVPKSQPGQYGIWILHRGETSLLPRTAYTALDPLDYQPPDRLEEITRLFG